MTCPIRSGLRRRPRGSSAHGEHRAAAGPVPAGDAPPVLLRDALDYGQPEAEAVRLGADEGEKNPLPLRVRHARPAIGHGDVHPLAVLTHRDVEHAPVRHGVEGVLPQVEEHLAELIAISAHRAYGWCADGPNADS